MTNTNPVISRLNSLSKQPQQRSNTLSQSTNITSISMNASQNTEDQPSQEQDHNHNHRSSQSENIQNTIEALQAAFVKAWEQYKFMHEDNTDLGKQLSPQSRAKFRRELQDLFTNSKIYNGTLSEYAADANAGAWADFNDKEIYFSKLDQANVMLHADRVAARDRLRREDRNERDDAYDDRDRDRTEVNPRSNRDAAAEQEQVCV